MEHRTFRFIAFLGLVVSSQAALSQQPPDIVASDQWGSTAAGSNALLLSQGGGGNTALGSDALTSLTTGDSNTAVGAGTLAETQTGLSNTAVGANAMASVFGMASDNVAIGVGALWRGGRGSGNTAVGFDALHGSETNSTIGNYNTALGFNALNQSDSGATYNTAVGSQALGSNTDGRGNNAVGYESLGDNTTAIDNNALGNLSLGDNTTGNFNTAVGDTTLRHNTVGASNAAFGRNALFSNTTGSDNAGFGVKAGYNLTTGSYNIDISNEGVAGESGVIRIGATGKQTAAFIAGISTTHLTGAAVYVDSSGQLGVLASSERYKTSIAPLTGNMRLDQLRPVTFHLTNEPRGAMQYGLIAEEVNRVYPALVIRDDAGNIQGIRYDELAPILLKELQDQRKSLRAQAVQLNQVLQQFATLKQQNDAIQAKLNRLDAKQERIAITATK